MAVRPAHGEGAGTVGAAEVGACDVCLEVGGVVVAVEVLEVVDRVGAFTLGFENSDPRDFN